MTSPKRFKGGSRLATTLLVAATVGLVTGIASCGGNGCEEVRETFCVCDLKSVSGASLRTLSVWAIGHHAPAVADTLAPDSIIVEADSGDSLMIDNESSPRNIELILNPDTTETRLRLLFTGTELNEPFQIYDTLTIRYEPYPYFLDMECGCSVYFTLHEAIATSSFIQSATIKKSSITNEEAINIVLEY